jgi:hypothetical protein
LIGAERQAGANEQLGIVIVVALSSPNPRRHIESELRGIQNDFGLLVVEYNLDGQPAFQTNKQLLTSLMGMASAHSASGDIVDDKGALRQERQGGVIELARSIYL